MSEDKKISNDAKIWRKALSSPSMDLEKIANRLDFFGLKELPEYQKALDALKAYETSAISKIDSLYKADSREESSLEKFETQEEWVKENLEDLAIKYGINEYLAVKNFEVIDHDKDQFKLAERIQRKYREQFVLISNIENILDPKVDHLESPEIEE
jgi:hypothetical protein